MLAPNRVHTSTCARLVHNAAQVARRLHINLSKTICLQVSTNISMWESVRRNPRYAGSHAAKFELFLVDVDTRHYANADKLMAEIRVWGLLQDLQTALLRHWADDCTPMLVIRYCGREGDKRVIENQLQRDIQDRMLWRLTPEQIGNDHRRR